jgi:predicted DsbA family dithiol-disulfide isomerase
MKREEAVEWFETHMPTKITPVAKQAYLIALTALRPVSWEQVEKVWRAHWRESTQLGGICVLLSLRI